MRLLARAATTLIAASCSTSAPSGDPATLGHTAYVVPSGWSAKDLSTHQRALFEWTPSSGENESGANDHKESLDVFRADRPALARAKNGEHHIEQLLQDAVQKLPGGAFGAPTHFTTTYGLRGVRVEGRFTPSGQKASYTRFHAVLVEGASLLHVVYTARDADRDHFDLVVDSFRAEGV